MADFLIAHKKTMGAEGGYSKNPHDHGGETYKGIARAFWGNWPGWVIIDQVLKSTTDQPIYGTGAYRNWVKYLNATLANHTALQTRVLEFYKANFWGPSRLDQVEDQRVADWIYDHAVNGGARGIKWIQEAAGVEADGSIGAKTIAAINAADPDALLDKATGIAVKYRLAKVAAEPDQRQFLHSWLARDGLTEEQIQKIMDGMKK
jgi:lysozyme family protein